MPLPHLDLKSRPNGSQSNAVSDLDPNSYRQQIRVRLQNTPRLASDSDYHTDKIDLKLYGDNSSYYQPVSRSDNLETFNRHSDLDETLKKSANSSMKRQIVFYNKSYVPSNSDKIHDEDDNNDVVVRNDPIQENYDKISAQTDDIILR